MTDRALLEAAAKAAGIGGGWDWPHGAKSPVCWRDASGKSWHPLTDDGDCARLESALLLHVEWHPINETVYAGSAEIGCNKPWGKDRQAARRAAAVRAAAEMAK